MAPKNKFTRAEMVTAAVRVVQKKGSRALTARAIADELGVSTQPIFTCFKTMEDAQNEVRAAAEEIYERYISEGLGASVPFYGFGMGYIRFAKEEQELYRLLFLDGAAHGENGAMEAMHRSQNLIRESLEKIYHMDADTADRYFRDMWLVVHSLATLIVTGECPYSEKEIGQILTGFSVGLCKAIKEIPGFVEGTFDRDKEFRRLIEG